jgi:hypothetical protein
MACLLEDEIRPLSSRDPDAVVEPTCVSAGNQSRPMAHRQQKAVARDLNNV